MHTIVITDSIKGSYASDGTNMLFMPSYPIEAKAKTGAGDAYTSGFLSAIIHGKDTQEAMMWGTSNASGVIQKFGAQEGLLSKKGIHTMIASYPSVAPQEIMKKR